MCDYSQMSVDSLIELKNLVEEYPYCQTTQILYLLNLKRLNEDTFDARLPHTAICVNNRQKLKHVVEQIEQILARETGLSGAGHEVRGTGCTTSTPRITQQSALRQAQRPHKQQTISERLNLQKSEPQQSTKTALPKPPQSHDDKLLEQLRLEALAKVNDRLNEVRKTMMVRTNFSETPNRMVAAQDIIDKVIATNPRISKVDDSDTRLNKLAHWKHKEEHSLREDFELVSETLAQLYITQGAHAKAREIYKTLSKTHPEKADYFTQLSKQIKSNHKPTLRQAQRP